MCRPAPPLPLAFLVCLNEQLCERDYLFRVLLFHGLPCECAPLFFLREVLQQGAPAFPFRMNAAGEQKGFSLGRGVLSVPQRTSICTVSVAIV